MQDCDAKYLLTHSYQKMKSRTGNLMNPEFRSPEALFQLRVFCHLFCTLHHYLIIAKIILYCKMQKKTLRLCKTKILQYPQKNCAKAKQVYENYTTYLLRRQRDQVPSNEMAHQFKFSFTKLNYFLPFASYMVQ